jgi:hypothetical protein
MAKSDRERTIARPVPLLLLPILLALLLLPPVVSLAGGPAPDTAKAGAAISKELDSAGGDPKAAAKGRDADGCGRYIEGLRVLYDRAGYDFDATALEIPEYVRRFGNEDVSDRELTGHMVTALLIAGIQVECPGGPGSYGKHFDARTAAAISAVLGQSK